MSDTALSWFIACTILHVIFIVVPTFMMYRLRHVDIIRKRRVSLMLFMAAVTLFLMCALLTYLKCFQPFQQQCFLLIFILNMGAPLLIYAYILKALLLVYENCKARMTLSKGISLDQISTFERFADYYFSLFRLLNHSSISPAFKLFLEKNANLKFNREISNTELIYAMLPAFIVSLLLLLPEFLVFKDYLMVMHGCPNVLIYMPVCAILITGILCIPSILYSIYWIDDELGLRNEIIRLIIGAGLFSIVMIIGFFNDAVSPNIFGNGMYALLIVYSSHFVSIIYPVILAYRHLYAISKFKKSNVDFSLMTLDSDLFQELKKMMIKELCIENALFLEESFKIKNEIIASTSNLESILTLSNRKLWILYYKYIEEGSLFQLNLSVASVNRIKLALDTNKECGMEIYDVVVEEVLRMVYENTYHRYMNARGDARISSPMLPKY